MILHSKILGDSIHPPILILHGFLGLSDNWKSIGIKLQNFGYQVHLIDQRNHGKSFHSDEFNYKLLARDLHQYITHHNLPQVTIIGHSMGGKTAMRYAVDHPHKIHKLIVVDIAPKRYPPSHQAILTGLNALTQVSITSRHQATEILQQYISAKPIQAFVLKNLYWQGAVLKLCLNTKALIQHYDEVLASPLLEGDRYVKNGVLFIQGTQSDYITQSALPLLAKYFPNHQLKKIDASHWVHADRPETLLQELIHYLESE